MTAFFIGTLSVKHPEKFQQYATSAKQTMDNYNGELIIKGKASNVLTGELNHQVAVVVKFPSVQHAKDWYQSKDYQGLIPLRDEAIDINITVYEQLG